MARQGSSTGRLFGAIFLLAGLVLLGVGAWTAKRQHTILTTWPAVEGEVTRSEVTHSTSRSSGSATSTTMYRTEVEFRYTIDGKEHLSPAVSAFSSSSFPDMKRRADAFPPGSRHPIRVNPEDANDIRYDAGWSWGFFLFPLLFGGMGLLFTGLGFMFLVILREKPPALCPGCGKEVVRGQRYCPNCAAPLDSI